jgi:serine protease Do
MPFIQRAAFRARLVFAALLLAAVLPARPADAREMMPGHHMMVDQAALVRSLLPTVVNITARAEINGAPPDLNAAADTADRFEIRVNIGSGFVVDPGGIIVTNWHVVDGAFEIYATFSDGTRLKAEVLNAARIIDIAVLKVDAGYPLTAARWGDSDTVEIGDPVLAIGNPLGVGLSVTAGIVSALNRNLMDTPYDDFIQTDAPINHGNSGGPLFNMRGEVIGINTALISPTTGSAGLGFAIPSNDAHFVVDRLIHYGWVRPAWLGVKIQQVTPDMANALGMQKPQGSIVAWVVKGGPAAGAGIRIGDIILRFNDREPTDDRALLRMIAASPPGEHVTFTVLRDGRTTEVPVTLGEWPKMQWEERDAPTRAAAPHWAVPPDLGLTVVPLTPEIRAKHDLAADQEGVVVTAIRRDTEAVHRGLSVGDIILRINDAPIGDAAAMRRQIDRVRALGREYALFLVYPQNPQNRNTKFPGPKWIALRVTSK